MVALTDYGGAIVARYTYDAWGKLLTVTDANGNDISSNASHIANLNPIRYRAYMYDTESGFYYLTSRYYDPVVGRFISADAYASTGQGYLGHNTFAYCGNNPVSRKDDGGEFWNVVGGAILGGILSGGLEILGQMAMGASWDEIDWVSVGIEFASGACTGALLASGVPVASSEFKLIKMAINGVTALAHSINDEDNLTMAAMKISGSIVLSGLEDLEYVPRHAKPIPILLDVAANELENSFWDFLEDRFYDHLPTMISGFAEKVSKLRYSKV